MGFVKEFKEFAIKGNVMDMAVGVIIGGAFGKIVTSLVSKITGGVNFKDLKIVLTPADEANKVAEVALAYGNFIQNVFDFLIIALCIFVMVKGINSLKKKEDEKPEEPPKPSNEEVLLTEIRDLLKDNK